MARSLAPTSGVPASWRGFPPLARRFEGGQGGAIAGRSGENRESGMPPQEKIVHEALREAFGLMETLAQHAAEAV